MRVKSSLSPEAQSLLLACYRGAYILADDVNRDVYGELADAGLMTPVHTPLGRNSAYRMTQEGVNASASLAPWPVEVPWPRRSRVAFYLQRLLALRHGFRIRLRPVRAR